jgi:hypothetical protein
MAALHIDPGGLHVELRVGRLWPLSVCVVSGQVCGVIAGCNVVKIKLDQDRVDRGRTSHGAYKARNSRTCRPGELTSRGSRESKARIGASALGIRCDVRIADNHEPKTVTALSWCSGAYDVKGKVSGKRLHIFRSLEPRIRGVVNDARH